jgi:pimeloyl-ACP methyl ester carboxylesterase
MSTNNTYLAVFLGSKTSPQMSTWNALPEEERRARQQDDCPTLVLVGNEDVLTPVSAARTIADGIVGSKLDIVQDCRHLSTMEQPDAVTEALRAWMDL